MVPGLGGHLVSEVFLETFLPTAGVSDGDPTRRQLANLRRQCASLGPATSPRALLETAAAPMVDLIGFEPPTDIATVDRVVAATILKAPGPHPRRSELKAALKAPGPHPRRSELKAALKAPETDVILGSRGPTPARSRSAASDLVRA